MPVKGAASGTMPAGSSSVLCHSAGPLERKRVTEDAAVEKNTVAAIEAISAVTLATHGMARAVAFYQTLGFTLRYGGQQAGFTSFTVGQGYLNLIPADPKVHWSWWGRIIFYVSDVDALYARCLAAGLQPATAPEDAAWGERFFHILDPDVHELSFARLLEAS